MLSFTIAAISMGATVPRCSGRRPPPLGCCHGRVHGARFGLKGEAQSHREATIQGKGAESQQRIGSHVFTKNAYSSVVARLVALASLQSQLFIERKSSEYTEFNSL